MRIIQMKAMPKRNYHLRRGALFSAALFCLSVSLSAMAATVVRGPYLQQGANSSIIIKWRTDSATDSRIDFGTTQGTLGQNVVDAASTTEHEVELTGLASHTRYFYAIGDSAGTSGDDTYHFRTSPDPGVTTPTRIWVIGDSGTANSNAWAVRDRYKEFTGSNETHLWLMLGDNAYNSGTDAEYQNAVFLTYPEILRQAPLWPTLGNHDGYSADSGTESGPYYDIFSLPKNAEVGGVASGTEAYYSFEYANIHFIVLDSYDTDRSTGGAMLTWLVNDLAANQREWVIAFWHHPPYTKGSHNSDTESQLIQMRENTLPILESWGVDLVLGGHSHSYERSYLLDGEYDTPTVFSLGDAVDSGDGKPGGDGAYTKSGIIGAANQGAVYAVAGSSGKISGGTLNHPVMYYSVNELGSMILDVDGNQLNATFLNSTGAIRDNFTISKGADTSPPTLVSVTATDAGSIAVDFSEPLNQATAEAIANYTLDNGVTIDTVLLDANGSSVLLGTSALSQGVTYTLTVNNVQDLAGNSIAVNSQQLFSYDPVTAIDFQNGESPSSGYSETRDTYLSENSPDSNFGSSTELLLDGDDPQGSGNDLATLVAWDISAVPTGAAIRSASVTFDVFNLSNDTYDLYQLLRSWDDGEASWNQASSGSSWQTSGAQGAADRGSEVLGTVSASSTGSYSIDLNAAGIAMVQDWVDGTASNHGIVLASSASSDGVDMRSSEYGTPASRPRLQIIYSSDTGGNNPPTAAFSYSTADLSVDFTDASSDSDGSIASWAWDFGDGSTATTENSSHTYGAAGTYTVSLTVTDDDGATDTATQSVTIMANVAPTAAFSHNCTDLNCSFTDGSSDSDGSIVSWAWDFGDTNGSTSQNPTHTYGAADTYTVSLSVTDDDGATDTASQSVTVTKGADTIPPTLVSVKATDAGSLVVDFSEPLNQATAEAIANYTLDNGVTIDSVLLDANGSSVLLGTLAMTENVTYTLTVNDVQDLAGNSIAADSQQQFSYDATRTIDNRISTGNDDVEEKTVDGAIYSTSTDIELGDDLSHNGEQTVGLRFQSVDIPQGATIDAAYLEFVVDETGSAATSVELRAQAIDDAPAFSTTTNYDVTSRTLTVAMTPWDIPSWDTVGEVRQSPGISELVQEVVNRSGWAADNDMVFVISGAGERTAESYDGVSSAAPLLHVEYTVGTAPAAPTAGFSVTSNDLTASFTDTSSDSDGSIASWSWNFGDASSDVVQNPSHTYAEAGTYSVTLTVTDDDGETDMATQSVTVSAANVGPTAGFSHSCTDLDCSFTDNSSDSDGSIASWAWNFGDGNSSPAQSPAHSYSAAGAYTVSLTVTDNDGETDMATQSVTVSAANVGPTAGFSHSCTDLDCSFTDNSSDSDGSIASWAWGFGEGSTATTQNSSHTYGTAGTYTVSLTVTDDDGATDTSSQSVTVTAANVGPTAAFSHACTDLNCSFTDGSSDSDGSIASWAWGFGEGSTATTQNSSHTYGTAGTYTVGLTVTDDDSATDTITATLTVAAPPPSTGPKLYVGTVEGVGSSSWSTVTLPYVYDSMVVVASAGYGAGGVPAVVRLQNAAGSSFEVMAQNPGNAVVSDVKVHYLVVEEGVYTAGEHGITMEAVNYLSSVTDDNNAWSGEQRSYLNSYANPVVLGQVMTSNDPAWSVFWSRGASVTSTPDSSALYTGKHVGEDSNNVRLDEIIGYVVVESGGGEVDGLGYIAGTGADTVSGFDDAPPYSYSIGGNLQSVSAAVVSQSAMDGNNGGWAIHYGLPTNNSLSLAIDEDQLADAERNHTNEQIAYLLVGAPRPPGPDPMLAHGVVANVSNSGWRTVTLAANYSSMVVVASANVDSSSPPLVTRIRNASANSFELRVDRADGLANPVSAVDVHYMVVEEGVYRHADHGITMEAVKFNSSVTDENNSWVGESRGYANAYSNPVVLGQVMSYNDAAWSVFWSRGSSRSTPPSASVLWVGKHVGEDPEATRADETLGYIVVEAGSGSVAGVNYFAAVGGDTIKGFGNSPPYGYAVSAPAAPVTAVVSAAAIDGGNGGWPVLYGANPLAASALNLAYDEDQMQDTERAHTTEQAAYLLFE